MYWYFSIVRPKMQEYCYNILSKRQQLFIMNQQYREMWSESGELPAIKYNTTESKHCLGKIVISKSQRSDNERLFYTISLKEDLFNNDSFKGKAIKETADIINGFFKKYSLNKQSKILVAGLGNDKVTADSLGSCVVDKLVVSSHLFSQENIRNRYGDLCAIKCGVSGTTGIPSYQIIKSVVSAVKPDMLLAIDTLAGTTTTSLAKTIQISDNGIEPGGGVNNPQTKLTFDTLGLPVIAIGVPLVIYVKRILIEYLGENNIKTDNELLSLVVTAKEIDFLIKDYSHILSESINRIVHNLPSEE